jgi:hypothetical protein
MKTRFAAALLVALALVLVATGGAWAVDYPRVSPKTTLSQTVGVTDVTVAYCRPSVRGRAIWGALVPYDKVWRTGANEATTITFSDEVTIEGTKLAAGTYGLFTIPGTTEWTVIFNKGAKQWGAYNYNAADDVLRIKVKPQAVAPTELLTFSFPAVSVSSAQVAVAWEKVQVAFTLTVDTIAKVLPQVRAAVAEAKADDARTPLQAAMFCLDNNVNLDEVGTWIERSITIKESMYNVLAKARLQAAQGKKADAIATAKRAIAVGKAASPNADTGMADGLIAEWSK